MSLKCLHFAVTLSHHNDYTVPYKASVRFQGVKRIDNGARGLYL